MTRLGPLLSPILIGRDELLDLADRRLADVASGQGHFLLLAGEAGIGKSRLIGAIERKARAAGFTTASGLVAPQDHDVPAASLLDLARTLTRLAAFEELGRHLLDLVESMVDVSRPPDMERRNRRLLVFDAVDRITTAVAGPTMLAFDDLQWTDDLSLEVLTELARGAQERSLLLVAAYRSDEVLPGSMLREWRSRLLTQRLAEEARLAPLDLDETALMTTLLIATGLPAPRDVVRAIHERTDGVPLHIEELMGALTEREWTDRQAIDEAAVPDTLEAAILQRVGHLSPEAQAVARAGAVIGRCFVPTVLAGIMDTPVDALDEPLRELTEHQVLDPPGPRGLYDFRHQLLRDALYRSLPERDRRRLHARAAEFGRDLEGASEIHASLHYERAGMPEQAFRSALKGAQAAARVSSHREAVGLYGRVVGNMPATLAPGERARVLEAYAVEAMATEDNAVAERAMTDARRLYQEAGDATGAARVLAALLGPPRRDARPLDGRLAMCEEAMHEIEALPDGDEKTALRADVALESAIALLDGMNLDRCYAAIEVAERAADVLDSDVLRLEAASIRGMADTFSGRIDDGLDRIGAVALEGRRLGLDATGVTAYRNASVAAERSMEYGRAAAWIQDGLRYADAIEQSHCAHVMASVGGLIAWAIGRWDDAVRRGQQALADRGCARASGMARCSLAYVALGRGDLDEAKAHLGSALAFGERSGVPDHVLAALWGMAEAALLGGDHAAAIQSTQRASELATASGERGRFVPFVVSGTRARIAGGQPDEATRWLGSCAAHLAGFEEVGSTALDHARGLVALANGSLVAARGHLERAVRGWEARGRAWEGLWARLDLAACLMRSHRHLDATGLLADVRARAQDIGSRPLLERVGELERQAQGRSAEAEPWRPLTVREFEVARLISGGRTNVEIATELGIAPKTVSAHVEHVLAKLGAGRRTEIASWVASLAATRRAPVAARARVAMATDTVPTH